MFFAVLLVVPLLGHAESITDSSRNRVIPIKKYFPKDTSRCKTKTPCSVALLSAGYGVSHEKYTFIADYLTQQGYLVVAVRHELPNDPPLSVSGNLYETRAENWQRGADTLSFVQRTLKSAMPNYNFDQVMLIGHSNGGDISSWLINHGATFATQLVTLDHRRVPLPRDKNIQVLSIRASDYPADPGVLYQANELDKSHCVVKVDNAKHNDMSDYGPAWLTTAIIEQLEKFIDNQGCSQRAG